MYSYSYTEYELGKKIESMNGDLYLVGGAVRDSIMGLQAHDRDYVITGLQESTFLRAFPEAKKTGNLFPVYRINIEGELCEVAFARSEKKDGVGHKGFAVEFSPTTTIEEDLRRRDLAMNAMAIHVLSKKVVDPFGGADDLEARRLRHVSEAFAEDPLRVLRAARFAAKMGGFSISAQTNALMKSLKEEMRSLPKERIFEEVKKAMETQKPSVFFYELETADCLEFVFEGPFEGRFMDEMPSVNTKVASATSKGGKLKATCKEWQMAEKIGHLLPSTMDPIAWVRFIQEGKKLFSIEELNALSGKKLDMASAAMASIKGDAFLHIPGRERREAIEQAQALAIAPLL